MTPNEARLVELRFGDERSINALKVLAIEQELAESARQSCAADRLRCIIGHLGDMEEDELAEWLPICARCAER